MEAHVVDKYLNERMKNIALRKKNLSIKARNYEPEERVKERSHYETDPIEERVRFSQEQRENNQKFSNQARMYDAIKNYQSGVITAADTDDQDTRTTAEKFRDIQFLKDSAYKYAYDLLRDRGETARFMDLLLKEGDLTYVFVQNFGMMKQKLAGAKMLIAEQLLIFTKNLAEKLKDSSYVDNSMTAKQFNKEMQKYKAPANTDIQQLKNIVQSLSSVDSAKVDDLLLRIDAIGRLAGEINQRQMNIESSLPSSEDIKQLLGQQIKTTLEASDFLEKAEKIMESVTKNETTRIMHELQNSNRQVNERFNDLSNQLQTYVAPTASELMELRQKINQLLDNRNKNQVLDKINALFRAVSQLPSNIVENINTKLPTQEDIQNLLTARDADFKQQISNVLSTVSPSALQQLLSDHTAVIKQHMDESFKNLTENYMIPTSAEISRLKTMVENLVTSSNKNDILARLDALDTVVKNINETTIPGIKTDIPSKEEIQAMLNMSRTEFIENADKLMGITKSALEEMMSAVDRKMDAFAQEMRQYIAPTQSELVQLRNRIENMQTTTEANKNDLLLKVEALSTVVNQLDKNVLDINTNVPSKGDLSRLLTASQEEFNNKVSEILAGIDKTSLEELLKSSIDRVEGRIDELSKQVKTYIVPTMSSLAHLHSKIENNDRMTDALKQELLQKTEMLGMMVNEVETKTIDAITNLPSKEDIESLVYEEVEEEELPAKAEAKLKSVTPQEVEKVKSESGTLKAFTTDGKFDIDKLKKFRRDYRITNKITHDLYRNFIAASQEEDIEDMKLYYKYVMYSLGFKVTAKTPRKMDEQLRSSRVTNRLINLGVKPMTRVNKTRTREEKASSELEDAVSVVRDAVDKNKDIFNGREEKQSSDDTVADSATVGMF